MSKARAENNICVELLEDSGALNVDRELSEPVAVWGGERQCERQMGGRRESRWRRPWRRRPQACLNQVRAVSLA